MKELLKPFIVSLAVLTLGYAFVTQAAPLLQYSRTILPEIDSAYELGTSTQAWLRGTFDELCLTDDTCKTEWASGGSQTPWTSDIDADNFSLTDVLGLTATRSTTTNATTTNFHISSFLSFASTIGDSWDDFCTAITGGSGLCDGTDADTNTTYTAGDGLTLTGTDFDFDGGTAPAGDLGGTWANPSVDNDSHFHTGLTLSGIDISDDTNLAGDTEIVLTGDALSIASTIARDTELHNAVTLAGEDYLTLATQQITANAIDPDNLSASDFGSFTCNGTACTVDAGAISNAMLANSTISGVSLGSNLADLTATNGTLTFSGTYNGGTARTIGLNLSNANTWTGGQIFGNATSTDFNITDSLLVGDITAPSLAPASTTAEFRIIDGNALIGNSTGPNLDFHRRDNGVTTGERLGSINFTSQDTNTGATTSASIVVDTTEDFTSGDAPTRLIFNTTRDATDFAVEAMRIDENGNLVISNDLVITELGTPAGTFLAVDSNGSVVGTTTPSGGGSPGGADTQIQFNDGGSTFGGDSAFTWNKTTDTLGIAGDITFDDELLFTNNSGSSIFKIGTDGTGDNTITVGGGSAASISVGGTASDIDILMFPKGSGSVNIKSRTDSASVQGLRIDGDRATPANGDEVYMSFFLSDDLPEQEEFARITAEATNVTNTGNNTTGALIFSLNQLGFTEAQGELTLSPSALSPFASNGNALGTGSLMWADLFLASGGVINWNNGDVTLTHSANTLTLGGGDLALGSNGLTMTGAFINESGSLEIPNGASPTTNATGELAFDTSDKQLVVYDGTNDGVIRTEERIFGFTLASTSPEFVSGGEIPVPLEKDGYTVTNIKCYVQGGTSVQLTLTDNTNAMDTLTCATTATTDDGAIANSTVTANELMYVDVGTITGEPDYVTFSVFGNWTRE